MISWKEKVTEKLSHLLADSSASHSQTSRESPVIKPDHKSIPSPTEELSNPRSSSYSSIFQFIFPDGKHSTSSVRDFRPSSFSSFHGKWRSKYSTWKGSSRQNNTPVLISEYESTVTSENCEINNTEHLSGNTSNNTSQKDKKELVMQDVESELLDLLDESCFITPNLFDFFQSSLPNIVRGCQWVLLYSTLKHGISLRTLLRKSADLPGPCLLIVGDMQGAVFGGLLEGPLIPMPKAKYQGTNQTFVFTTIHGEPRLFRSTGANKYYYLCLNESLALGGGGSFALYLDGDLLHGTSGPCETFGNLCLAHSREFELKNVELWGFTHSSQYLG